VCFVPLIAVGCSTTALALGRFANSPRGLERIATGARLLATDRSFASTLAARRAARMHDSELVAPQPRRSRAPLYHTRAALSALSLSNQTTVTFND
jgi:hypothetical protein